ncbi:MAG TPA: TonB-dependent receptor [Saprospiraceae bacterium]|nr:TonB-dependent receptor [Saprospiraceae bacterium]
MKKTCILLPLFLLSSFMLLAQRYTVKGRVIDNEKTELISATAIMINPKDSVMIAFAITDVEGRFELNDVPKGDFKLQITYIGYGTFEKIHSIGGEGREVDLGDIVIYQSTNLLSEVKIEADYIPIVVKKDTVEYNADAFRVQPNANVEELLKRLPGVEVDGEGNVTAGGEAINKILVDGKAFFGNDPKMATKNLPANMVGKVQVIDQKSERTQFSGVDDGVTEKIINLELKANAKIGVFGELVGGYGTDNRFESKVMLNKFGSKYQISSLATFNNINQQGFSFQDFGTLMGSASSAFRGNQRGPVNFGGMGNGDTKSLTGGLNFNYNFTPKTLLTTSYFLTYVDRTQFEFRNRQNFLGERSFSVLDTSYTDSYSLGHNINSRFEARPDSIQRIVIDGSLRINSSNQDVDAFTQTINTLNILENSTDNLEKSTGTNTDLSVNADYSIRLGKPGRIASATLNLANTVVENESNYDQEQFVERNNTIKNIIQRQLSNNDNQNFRINVNYKEPLGNNNYFDLNYTRRNYNTNRIKDFYDLDPLDRTIETLNLALSTAVDNSILYDRFGTGWSKITPYVNLSTELVYQISTIQSREKETLQFNKPFHYLLPGVNINFPKKRFNVRYSTSINEPSVTQIQPIIDNSNPLNIYQGNPSLSPEYNHDINLRYNFFDAFKLLGVFANVSYRYTNDKIVNQVNIDEFLIRRTSPINIGNAQRVNTNLNFNSPIRPIKLRTRVNLGGMWNVSQNFVNNVQNTVNSYGPSLRVELENMKTEKVQVTASSRYAYSYNAYSNDNSLNAGFLNQTYNVGTILNLGKGWVFDASYNYNIFSKETYGDNNTLSLFNASIMKRMYNNKLTAKLSAFDILNQNRGIARNAAETYIEEVINNSIQQYFMLTLNYRLNNFNPNQGGGGMRMMGGGRM